MEIKKENRESAGEQEIFWKKAIVFGVVFV